MELTQIIEALTDAVINFVESGAIEKILAAAEGALPYVEKILGAVVSLVSG